MERTHFTVQEWEALIGEQVRTVRVAQDLDQARLAALANVSVGALSNLERGKGSSLSTVVAVVRALDCSQWLQGLAPAVGVSPMHLLRAKRHSPKQRVRTKTDDLPPNEER